MEYIFLALSIIGLLISLILLIKSSIQDTIKKQIEKEKRIDIEIIKRRDYFLHNQEERNLNKILKKKREQ